MEPTVSVGRTVLARENKDVVVGIIVLVAMASLLYLGFGVNPFLSLALATALGVGSALLVDKLQG